MKDAFAPGPLDESYVVSRTHFRYCVEGHHRLDLWNSGIFRMVQRAVCASEWDSFSLLLPCPPLPLVEFLRSFPSDQTTKW